MNLSAYFEDIEDLSIIQTSLHKKKLFAEFLATPLGSMLAIGDEKALYLLEFLEKKNLIQEWKQLEKRTDSKILLGPSDPIQSIRLELASYFAGSLKEFKTPLLSLGTPFQLQVWEALQTIPFGQTRSYAEIARAIGSPNACRAVARANSMNRIVIAIPCHRVIETGGALGGYSGGIFRKKSLLETEFRFYRTEKKS